MIPFGGGGGMLAGGVDERGQPCGPREPEMPLEINRQRPIRPNQNDPCRRPPLLGVEPIPALERHHVGRQIVGNTRDTAR